MTVPPSLQQLNILMIHQRNLFVDQILSAVTTFLGNHYQLQLLPFLQHTLTNIPFITTNQEWARRPRSIVSLNTEMTDTHSVTEVTDHTHARMFHLKVTFCVTNIVHLHFHDRLFYDYRICTFGDDLCFSLSFLCNGFSLFFFLFFGYKM